MRFLAPNHQESTGPLEPMPLKSHLRAAEISLKRKTKILANSLITIVIRRDTLTINTLRLASQKTSMSHDNRYIGD